MPAESTVPLSIRLPGGFLMTAGAALYFSCLWDFTVHRTRNSSRVGSASGFRFQRPLSLRQKSDVLGHRQHLGLERLCFFQSALLAWMAAGFAVGFHLVRCVLRGTGIEAKVWCFVRAVLLAKSRGGYRGGLNDSRRQAHGRRLGEVCPAVFVARHLCRGRARRPRTIFWRILRLKSK